MNNSENTFSAILARLKNNIGSDITILEGTWTADLLQAVANELARIYSMEIEPAYKKAFITTAEGEDLDRCCADYGIERTAATYSEGIVRLTGIPGTYYNLQVRANDIIYSLPEKVIIPDTGVVNVRCVCMESGIRGNVPAGAINRLTINSFQITDVVNPAPISEGYDSETDDSLKARTLEYINEPPTSGNIANYKEWAMKISGVENAQVFDLARGNGTVDIVIIADGNKVASQQLCDTVHAYIEKQRPIGADVKVCAASRTDILICASVKVKKGYTAELIADELYRNLEEYLSTLVTRNPLISYIKMADIIFSCEGMKDVTDYTLNGGRVSITLEDRCFPTAAMPKITLEE